MNEQSKRKGGKRPGAGRKSIWDGLPTKTISIPVKYERKVRNFLREILEEDRAKALLRARQKEADKREGNLFDF